ncbi:MAG: tyrosine-type recombinase/integrase, partial [Acidimicrobiales bacterium]
MDHASRWLGEHDLGAEEFTSEHADQYLADRRASGQVRRLTPRGLIPLLGYLRGIGVVPETTVPKAEDPKGHLLEEFAEYLATERGLAPKTIAGYRYVAGLFLDACAPDATAVGCGVSQLDIAEINVFLLSECARRSVGSASNVVTALRALLRFLYHHDYTANSLTDCVPKAAAWRESGRSRALEPEAVRLLLASCDRRTSAGRRDFAILTLLARLGLRANEVATLSLDDVDWNGGTIMVTGKGSRRDSLPLPVDVGQAMADYCRRGRPRNDHRGLFLQVRAPYGALTSDMVAAVVCRACHRAGIPAVGAHRLRHTSASAMRRAGAPL